MNQKERGLFIAIWLVLLIAVGMWQFRPNSEMNTSESTISIILSPELHDIFELKTKLIESPLMFTAQLTLLASYLKRFDTEKQFILGYNLESRQHVLFRGTTQGVIAPSQTLASFDLPNPRQVAPTAIRLFFTH